MKKIKTGSFSLKHTLECGQIFRYNLINSFYYIVAGDKVLKLKQEGSDLLYSSNSSAVDESFITSFFRLDDDYNRIIREISKDEHMAEAVKNYPGMRLVRQQPSECLISYICSAASNIPQIRKNLDSLARCFGTKITFDNREFYSFPTGFSDLEKIGSCGVGFRKNYVYAAAKTISGDKHYFSRIKKLKYGAARAELKQLPGVADKVADCTLLFSLDFLEAFPVDTWVRKAMKRLYFNNKNVSDNEIREFARQRFGSCAGYAQQFIFYSERTKKRKAL